MKSDVTKEIEELESLLYALQSQNQDLYLQNVRPFLREKLVDFLSDFELYFRERGFVVKKRNEKVNADYMGLNFSASLEEDGENQYHVVIRKDREEIEEVKVRYNTLSSTFAYSVPPDEFEAEKVRLTKEIEREQKKTRYFQQPKFYLLRTVANEGFSTGESLLEELFDTP
jgi:molybdate-binding protein